MSVFCPVAPARVLVELMRVDPKTVKHNLFLAHDVVKDQEYCKFSTFPHFSFMDNSLVELGGAVDLEMVAEAVRMTCSNVYVMPDVYRDGLETIDAIRTAWESWRQKISNAQPLCVIQGRDERDWIRCLEAVAKLNPPWISVPRVACEWAGSRAQLIALAHAYMPKARIHLLGFSDSMVTDILDARSPHVSSIDSAVPLRIATQEGMFSLNSDPGKRGTWFETCTFNSLMATNINIVNRLLSNTNQERRADISM